jgi:glutathione S-transferase
MDTPLLWHIPLSHFSEKARWALDYKRIAHHRQVLGPDYLIRAWRARGRGTLPIADLAAAAMLGVLLQPPEIQYPLRVELPPYLQDYRGALLQHPASQWAAGIYRLHRGGSAAVSRRPAAG